MGGYDRRTVRDLRRNNRAAVLRRLYFEGPLSRQELGPATGLSSGSISNVVTELLAEGVLEEAGSVGSDGGRPRTLLRVAAHCACLVGVDVGETRVRVELFDMMLTEVARSEQPLDDGRHDAALVVQLIEKGLASVLAQVGASTGPLLGVGVGVPGIVERRAHGGALVHGQTIGWDAVPLEAMLRESGGITQGDALAEGRRAPLHIDNGAKTLGQAEMWFGAGRGARDAVIALIGSGVGACVVTGGEPYSGASSGAGEWGHTVLTVGGRRCRCGARGCLEAYVGAAAVIDRWREAGGEPDGGDEETVLAELLATGGGEGAPGRLAREVLAETAEYLGAGIADLVNLFNPERIVIGGWAGLLLGPQLLPAVREATDAYALRYPAARTAVELCRLGPDAVTVGAATLPLRRFLDAGGSPPPGVALSV
ncbi:ROK family transcriptional regulator [Streptomyces abyssalis]|uniref:ROK family transcriptional regulator n=1 Tax=Streptomyces abyssalis TaxID=933944 RepID=A0A1E7JRW1_9ACTN|nr:ROK family transcriptional regulator [Streptomyces abyssalis]OEU91644.1 ROK family transcriptional regulator [Streptomyces abyssalis]OEU94219.1 ROK family transcriptional regulator [Streptomyces abyssalis]OEV28195.1 ROK family transcriptional regulator [Streptomyces nanshensis]